MEENDFDEETEEFIEHCDDVFYDNEEQINLMLQEYANELEVSLEKILVFNQFFFGPYTLKRHSSTEGCRFLYMKLHPYAK